MGSGATGSIDSNSSSADNKDGTIEHVTPWIRDHKHSTIITP